MFWIRKVLFVFNNGMDLIGTKCFFLFLNNFYVGKNYEIRYTIIYIHIYNKNKVHDRKIENVENESKV